ncbi:MAG: MBL fold metallo-hydrolase [Candidatus Scalindua sp. AMX11]|nr:MAG: MBL fold metallo-hydrolase [Candidatus Scalindua sp.]NOG84573.1 MBL fold metallo-hydrolase [Planctomycetota bacterium]RZV92348.1 MAG: MBL fold metallo-hydrolase [Candidatus Scalindua sp. SCAELEC01]TDE66127.1 MAG: MBL fold metallo-hydrolase [Candidatus Scalindua sp. AMX11]GJQ59101.1 MAG: MBL fold metallo-hydrolase [Candidatus Scalindua sp.]
MIIKKVVVGPLEVNCFIIACEESKKAAIIDPGGDADDIINTIENEGLKPEFIINTHAHFDHVGAVKTLQEHFKIDFLLHKDDLFLIDTLDKQVMMFGLDQVEKPEVNKFVSGGDTVTLGQLTIKIIHTPGHTPGGVCYFVDETLFVGDTLFAGSIGRTDFPGSSYDQLIHSIKENLFPLGDNVTVYAGHGPSTTIGNEKAHNPFLT